MADTVIEKIRIDNLAGETPTVGSTTANWLTGTGLITFTGGRYEKIGGGRFNKLPGSKFDFQQFKTPMKPSLLYK